MKTLIIAYTAMLATYVLIAVVTSAIYHAIGNRFSEGLLKAVPGFIGLVLNYALCAALLYGFGLIR